MAADAWFALDQKNLLAGVAQRESGVNAGNTTTDHQHVRVDGHLDRGQRLVETNPMHRGMGQRLRLGSGFRGIGMHPGVVLPDVHHLEEEGVQPAALSGGPERVLMEQG